MTSGKCPHPWNKNKKGTFLKGHTQINNGKGYFEKGRKIPEWQKQANSLIQTERYELGLHPLKKLNKLAFENRLITNWYGIGRANWKKKSKEILFRDGHHCMRCHKSINKYSYNCHHKIPYQISKNNSDNNLVSLCRSCHTIEEWKIRKELNKSKNIQRFK